MGSYRGSVEVYSTGRKIYGRQQPLNILIGSIEGAHEPYDAISGLKDVEEHLFNDKIDHRLLHTREHRVGLDRIHDVDSVARFKGFCQTRRHTIRMVGIAPPQIRGKQRPKLDSDVSHLAGENLFLFAP